MARAGGKHYRCNHGTDPGSYTALAAPLQGEPSGGKRGARYGQQKQDT